MRHLRQDRIEQAIGAVASETGLDGVRRPARPLGLEQKIHVEPVPAVRRDPPRRGMRLLDVALFLEPRQDVSDSRRRHTEPRRRHEE